MMNANASILTFSPIQQFIKVLGKDIENYFGKDPACIISLRPDGVFYGTGLYEWLQRKKKDVVLTTMEDDGQDLDEEKVKGRKVLIVDNDIVTGKGYKRSMEALRLRKAKLQIKDIRFATFYDRIGLADFAVGKYSAEAIWHLEELDAIDLKIIAELAQDGRKSFVKLGEKLHISPVAVKNRVEKLLKDKIIKIQGGLNVDQFYTMSAHIGVEANEETIRQLIERCEKYQEVYHLARISGRYNLAIGILAHNFENIEEFIDQEIRTLQGVKQINVYVGELPLRPKTIPPQI